MARRERRLPIQQLTILSICRFAEPVVLTSVFPYLPEMIESFDVPKADVAKWAGITAAVFSLCQCVTAIPWGWASDRLGRKPTILLGIMNTMTTSILWGFSTSVPMAITMRALAGAGNGNVGIIRTMVAEMVPWKELQPRAFSIMPLVWGIGSVFGPAIGGTLANPLRIRPGEPRRNSLLECFPYLLPNLVAAGLFLIGILTGFLFLQETLESVKHRRDYGLILGRKLSAFTDIQITRMKNWWRQSRGHETEPLLKPLNASETTIADEESPSTDSAKKNASHNTPPSWSSVFTFQSVLILLVYASLAFHSLGFDQLLPIFMHHPVQDKRSSDIRLPFKFAGGFGNNSQQIGLLFTIYGLVGMFGQFLIFPPVARRYGVLSCFRVVLPVFPFIYILMPFTALLPTDTTRRTAACILMLFKAMACVFAFPCSTIMITNSARSLRVLGTLNGVSVSVSAMGRAAGPAVGGAVFSCAVKHGYVIVPWWIYSAVAVLGTIPLCFIVEGKGFGEDDDVTTDDENAPRSDDSVRSSDGSSSSSRNNNNATDNESNDENGGDSERRGQAHNRSRRKGIRKQEHISNSTSNPGSNQVSRPSTSTNTIPSQNTSTSNTIVGDNDSNDDGDGEEDDSDDSSINSLSNKPILRRGLGTHSN